MKQLPIVLVLFLLCLGAKAQNLQAKYIVTGTVVDSTSNRPLDFVTVLLVGMDDKARKSTLSKSDGSFEFKNLDSLNYKLSFSLIGFENKQLSIEPRKIKNGIVQTGTIKMRVAATGLKEVTVSASKPIVRQEVDRIAYNVQNDPESQTLTVLDMLRKVPLISVDASDNIKLKGNTNYKIFINGRPSAMLARNPADVFKSMPAENIEKIEVITTPPAKYDAEGLAGIINIITKKKIDEGYNGRVSFGYNTVSGPGTNFNGTLKKGKIGISGYVGYNKQREQRAASGLTNEIFSPVQSLLIQEGQRTWKGDNTYGSAELSFEIDTLNLLTGNIEHYNGNYDQNNNQFSRFYGTGGSIEQTFRQLNTLGNAYTGTDMALNYQLSFKKSKERLLTTSYKYSSSSNDQSTDAAFSELINYNRADFRQFNNSGTKEHTAQIDYVHPVRSLNVEGGFKAILRNNYSDFRTFNKSGNDYLEESSLSNIFDYHQDVYSLYNSYQYKGKKWVFKVGGRLELTRVDADFLSSNGHLDLNYENFIPSLSVQRVLSETNNLTLGYSERIQRPGIWELNPFVDRSNPQSVWSGNPNLDAVVNRSVELNYSNFKKGSFNLGLSYSFANNTIENVSSVGADTVTRTTYLNVGKNKRLGMSLSTNYPVTSKLNINLNGQLIHVWLKGSYNGELYDKSGFQGYVFTNASYKIRKDLSAGADFGFDSRYVLLQGRDNYYISSSASLTKSFFDEKLTLSYYLSNPFKKYRRNDFYTNTQDFRQSSYSDVYFRRMYFRVSYKFGNQKSSVKKNERGINNDDVSSGRSNR